MAACLDRPNSPREYADFLLVRAREAGIAGERELANFMAHAQIETNGFRSLAENMNYSARRLLEVFPGRNGIDRLEEAQRIVAGGPRAIANAVYGGTWGRRNLGNTEPDDGWNFRGRGYFQLTGRANYAAANDGLRAVLGVDIAQHPERLADPEVAAATAIHYWKTRVVARGHQDDITRSTYALNAAGLHLHERREAAAEWERKLERGYQPVSRYRESLPRMADEPVLPFASAHPAHALHRQAYERLQALERQRGIDSGPHTAKLALALTDEALRAGLTRIDRVELNELGTKARAVQFSSLGDDPLFNSTSAAVDIVAALRRAAAEPENGAMTASASVSAATEVASVRQAVAR